MDWSIVTGALASLKTAKEIGGSLLELNNFSESAAKVAELNSLLLQAQERLFTHNTQLAELQQQHFESREELRKLRESIAQRDRYTLFELSNGVFVYRVDVSPRLSGTGDPLPTEPEHYVCQRCADKGVKSVLQKRSGPTVVHLFCGECGGKFPTGDRSNRVTLSNHLAR